MKKELLFQEIIERLNHFPLPSFDLVIGIADGGVVPAALVANKLGCDLKLMKIRFRDKNNTPLQSNPEIQERPPVPETIQTLLIVDDVSVTGKTLESARKSLNAFRVSTLVFKGNADFVLFPEIAGCIQWPWKMD